MLGLLACVSTTGHVWLHRDISSQFWCFLPFDPLVAFKTLISVHISPKEIFGPQIKYFHCGCSVPEKRENSNAQSSTSDGTTPLVSNEVRNETTCICVKGVIITHRREVRCGLHEYYQKGFCHEYSD